MKYCCPEIIIKKQDGMVEISQKMMSETKSILLSGNSIRKVLVWLKRELPDTTREIFCADCPDYICHGYQVNESERGHKNR